MLKALIFDVDGTLSDTDPVHLKAFQDYLAPYGIAVDRQIYRTAIQGRTNRAIFGDMFPGLAPEELDRLGDEKEALYRRLAPDLPPLAGLDALIDWAQAQRLKLAVVTNGPRLNLDHALEALGLRDRIEIHLAREDVAKGKPDPLPYLTALERLGVTAGEAVVFEDSPSGVRSAAAAGITTFGILTGQTDAALREAGASATIRDYADPALWAWLEAAAQAAA
ncbi:MAG TPA: HAD family phosphatase [Microvirga sp.]|jgi:beta-phosphoglucomutase|nr:HAD family phosphatase [Microvirga sp.]